MKKKEEVDDDDDDEEISLVTPFQTDSSPVMIRTSFDADNFDLYE